MFWKCFSNEQLCSGFITLNNKCVSHVVALTAIYNSTAINQLLLFQSTGISDPNHKSNRIIELPLQVTVVLSVPLSFELLEFPASRAALHTGRGTDHSDEESSDTSSDSDDQPPRLRYKTLCRNNDYNVNHDVFVTILHKDKFNSNFQNFRSSICDDYCLFLAAQNFKKSSETITYSSHSYRSVVYGSMLQSKTQIFASKYV